MKKIAYHYVMNTMSDWETGYLTAELNTGRFCKKDATKYNVKTFAMTKEPIITMGGIHIIPDYSINDCTFEDAGILILPGAETWLEPIHTPVLEKAKEFLESGTPVAAICGATMALAKAGILNNRYHTSNDLNYLKSLCPEYTAEKFYRMEPAVTDSNLITASGMAPLEFAYQTLKQLGVFSPDGLEAWYNLNKTHEPKYFFDLMKALE